MKSLAVALTLFAGVFAHADCTVSSYNYPELTDGLNAEVICREVSRAIDEQTGLKAKDYSIYVGAYGARDTFSVELTTIHLFQKNSNSRVQYMTKGVLHWYPGGDAYVHLNESFVGKAAELKGPINEIINK